VPVALHALAEDGPVKQVEGGKQGSRAVADIVVGHRPGAALFHRQTRLGAIERLDLALLIDREHQAMRISVLGTARTHILKKRRGPSGSGSSSR
jgi:hypothetical protein